MNKEQFRDRVLKAAVEAFPALRGEEFSLTVQYPKEVFGHFSTSAALELSKILKQPPQSIAQSIIKELEKDGDFGRLQVDGPGFINMKLSSLALKNSLLESGQFCEKGGEDKNLSVLLEFVSANPTGPLHIGHGRWAAVGDSLARILSYLGYKVSTEFYVNDFGNQIQLLRDSVKAIQEGKPVPENGYRGQYMQVFKEVTKDPVIYFIEDQDRLLKKMNVHFDGFFRESSLHESDKVRRALEEAEKRGILYKREGATWFKTTQFGDDKDRVLIKSDGLMTYYVSDVAYHRDKVERGYDVLINILGADHHGYVKRLEAIVKLFAHRKVKFVNIVGQLVSLFRDGAPVRMSKRTGEMITLEEVVDEIGVDAIRYFLTMQSMNNPLDFDLGLATKKDSDNPVYYVQYAHARISSVLAKAEELGLSPVSEEVFDYDLIRGEMEDQIVLMLGRFEETLKEIENSFQPYHLCVYLYGLASLFHRFYIQSKFIDEEAPEKSRHFLFFIKKIRETLRQSLTLLGISAPEKM